MKSAPKFLILFILTKSHTGGPPPALVYKGCEEPWLNAMLLLPGSGPAGLNNSTEIRLLLCYLVQHSGPHHPAAA